MTYRKKLTTNDVLKLLLQNKDFSNCIIDDEIEYEKIKQYSELFQPDLYNSLDTEDLDKMSDAWFIPDKYKTLDVEQYLFNKCKNELEIARVEKELILYKKKKLIPLLQFLIYLVDHMRENNITWGVGRGSSVSSYILYLIGIHKINSIKYDLNIEEFLK